MKRICLTLAMSAGMVTGYPAGAATILTDREAFDAQGRGVGYLQNFDAFENSQYAPFTVGAFKGVGNIMRMRGTGTAGLSGNVNGTGYLQYRLSYWDYFSDPDAGVGTIISDSAVRMIGFDLRGQPTDENRLLSYRTNTGETGSFRLPGTNTAAFIGLVFDAPVTSFTILPTWEQGRNGSIWFDMDNLRSHTEVAATAAVPEPATWAMMIAGFCVTGGALRRRRKVRGGGRPYDGLGAGLAAR